MSGHTKPKMKRMRIYFDGCSKTGGYSLSGRVDRRYPKLLCEKFNAEEYNIAQRSGSNKRLVRNLLEHDLSKFDLFVIQMTKRKRLEYYDKKSKGWVSIGYRNTTLPPKITGLSHDIPIDYVEMRDENERDVSFHTIWRGDVISLNDVRRLGRGTDKEVYKINEVSTDKKNLIKYYLHYYRNVYTEEQGKIDEQMCFSTMKSILKNYKHIIIYMHSDNKTYVPVDLQYKKGKDYESGWYMGADTHKIILDDILRLL